MQDIRAGTDRNLHRMEPINHHPQAGKPPSHSATPELLQLLTSSLARLFTRSYLRTPRTPNAERSTLTVLTPKCPPAQFANLGSGSGTRFGGLFPE